MRGQERAHSFSSLDSVFHFMLLSPEIGSAQKEAGVSLPLGPQTQVRHDHPPSPPTVPGLDHSQCHPLSPALGRDGGYSSLQAPGPSYSCSVPAAQIRACKSAGRRETHEHRHKTTKTACMQVQQSVRYHVSPLQTRGNHDTHIMVSVRTKQVRQQTQCPAHRKRTIHSNLGFFFSLFHPRTTEKQPRASQKQRS